MACSADISKESAVVTKNFTVLEAEDCDSSDTSVEETVSLYALGGLE